MKLKMKVKMKIKIGDFHTCTYNTIGDLQIKRKMCFHFSLLSFILETHIKIKNKEKEEYLWNVGVGMCCVGMCCVVHYVTHIFYRFGYFRCLEMSIFAKKNILKLLAKLIVILSLLCWWRYTYTSHLCAYRYRCLSYQL